MLLPPFNSYTEFKELFGMVEHGNGSKSRKNLILLKYIKTAAIRKLAISTGDYAILDIRNMAGLKKLIFDRLQINDSELQYKVRLINYTFHSNIYETDEKEGSCVDGDLNAIRYLKHEPNRTLQATIFRTFLKLVRTMGSDAYGYDLRNEACHNISKELCDTDAVTNGYVPFI